MSGPVLEHNGLAGPRGAPARAMVDNVSDEISCIEPEHSSESGSTLKAHDYIGLSEATSSLAGVDSLDMEQKNVSLDLNLGETELCLGLGKKFSGSRELIKESSAEKKEPKEAANMDKSSETESETKMKAAPEKEKDLADDRQGLQELRGMLPPLSAAMWQAHMNGKSGEEYAAAARNGRNVAQGTAIAKGVVSGAKRGFTEAIGSGFADGRPVPASDSEQKGVNLLIPPMYPWSSSKQVPAGWRSNAEQPKNSFFKGNQSKNEENANPQNASSEPKSAAAASPPVVGWPPVQNFRKQTLAAHTPQKNATETQAATSVQTSPVPSPVPAAAQGGSFYVKVYMDGVPIGRKVDLRTYNSYDKLSVALEEMFRRFTSGQGASAQSSLMREQCENKKLNFIQGYVLTYEDKDGDLMLVGDVPWGMFTGTVKRLRIMKGSEAIGLDKCKGAN